MRKSCISYLDQLIMGTLIDSASNVVMPLIIDCPTDDHPGKTSLQGSQLFKWPSKSFIMNAEFVYVPNAEATHSKVGDFYNHPEATITTVSDRKGQKQLSQKSWQMQQKKRQRGRVFGNFCTQGNHNYGVDSRDNQNTAQGAPTHACCQLCNLSMCMSSKV
ncbi:hypothetical protein OIU85_007573 [Salix viminalis]|uniref:Uncharacterized protein n=1 Tax=Salix viminalis TaxID=40686 RepID=A0A9Q0P9D8_SALVM|nr:hypothetical protein OIU85_007573 [Salix viminalis]